LTKLCILTAKKLEAVLFYLGFKKIRQKGSHVFYRHSDGRRTTIPHHKGKTLARSLLRAILREINIELERFNEILKKV